MPTLKNARHERFAQAIARGLTATDAYQEAGYRGVNHAWRLRRRPEVDRRIEALIWEQEDRERRDRLERTHYLEMEERAQQDKMLERVTPAAMMSRLIHMSSHVDKTQPSGVREARRTLLEAFHIGQMLLRARAAASRLEGAERRESAALIDVAPKDAILSHSEPYDAPDSAADPTNEPF